MEKKILHDEMVDVLIKDLESYENALDVKEIGYVIMVKDGVASVYGLDNVEMNELVAFTDRDGSQGSIQAHGIVQNMSKSVVDIIILGSGAGVCEGSLAKRTGEVVSVNVGPGLLGRVVNALGDPIDGKGEIESNLRYPIERPAPSVIDRQSVKEPINTGWKAIDTLVPIGRGQRELIIGDRKTGKTTIAVDVILSQKQHNLAVGEKDKVYCVYVAIGQKQSSVASIVKRLEDGGAMDYTVVVCAGASESAAMLYIAPYSGVSIAEFFRDNGMHCIIVYDDLSKHAVAYRELSLLLRNPPGREAYPGDVFYLHSRLLERAAKLSDENGGGSLTALPIVETQADDVSSYIPTNVISITDGQIFLGTGLFNSGVLPAINVGLSVSRVGSAAQTPAIKKLAGSIKLDLAQYRELEDFSRFGSELDVSTQKLLNKGRRTVELLKQKQHSPMTFAEQTIVLFANNNGYFDDVAVDQVRNLEQHILALMHSSHIDVLHAVEESRAVDDDMQVVLKRCLSDICSSFATNNKKSVKDAH